MLYSSPIKNGQRYNPSITQRFMYHAACSADVQQYRLLAAHQNRFFLPLCPTLISRSAPTSQVKLTNEWP